ncbi:TPA: restriction endonuclease subunit S [Citrobacter freundii]|uniref:restriction endonuclease subunit S n=1 Tax=Citrobacter freundii TaxID=546 RepID=UPI00259D7C45|nr:restriction endonuclease subunit S [Citrobacter freundii]HCK0216309.1 restriction endonuclease subunit S [Citrobacter freundii]HEB0902634.1 restriction endonuclease subunit S [Citrobacter freundii]HEB0907354.1 restriction endonuclease subunit S [Citrobacter freundii]
MGNEDFKLPPGWHCRSLVDCTKGGNISYGIVQPGQHQDDGIGIIRVNNIQNGKISVADVLKVSHDIESKFSKTRLEGGEVLLTLVGSTGLSAITTKDLHGWNVARAIAVIKPSDEISAEWIHICLQSPYTKYFLDSRANTTVQKTLNLKDVKEIPLPIPPIEERMNLEKIYFDLENKINLNLEINQTLEQMSQTLFKSWFVDFDPVIDNALDAGNPIPEMLQSRAELRQKVRNSANFKPLPADIRALFPAEFEETELGWAPKGWQTKSMHDLVESVSITFPLSKTDKVIFLNTGDIEKGSFLHKNYSKTEGLPGQAKKSIKKGDILFSEIRPENKRYAFVHFESDDYVVSTKLMVLRAKNEINPLLPYFIITLEDNTKKLQRIAELRSGTFPQITFKELEFISFIMPNNDKIMKLFINSYLAPTYNKIIETKKANINLTNLRDTLLPKLISGELSLEDLPNLVAQTEPA